MSELTPGWSTPPETDQSPAPHRPVIILNMTDHAIVAAHAMVSAAAAWRATLVRRPVATLIAMKVGQVLRLLRREG